MTTELLKAGGRRELATTTPLDDWRSLDIHAPGGVSERPVYAESLATISLGYRVERDGRSYPKAARAGDKQYIHLHDQQERAPALKTALEAGGYRTLTVAFPFNDPAAFIQQRFMAYSTSALLGYGDERGITWIKNTRENPDDPRSKIVATEHVFCPPGSEAFDRARHKCKVATSVYFYLAEWGADGPRVLFDDGVMPYRIRTTSKNSVNALLAQLQEIARYTHGQIAGIPFELGVDFREHADPTGAKRDIPIWTLVARSPDGMSLSSRTFRQIVTQGLHEGQQLMLEAPRIAAETIEQAKADFLELGHEPDVNPVEIIEPDDDELALLAAGGRCNARSWRRSIFQTLKTMSHPATTDEAARAELVSTLTEGEHDSLSEFLRGATEVEAGRFAYSLEYHLRGKAPPGRDHTPEEIAAGAALYREIVTDDDDPIGTAKLQRAAEPPVSEPEPDPGDDDDAAQDPLETWDELDERAAQLELAGDDDPSVETETDDPDTGADVDLYERLCAAIAAAQNGAALAAVEAAAKGCRGDLSLDQRTDLKHRIADRRATPSAAR